MSAALTHEDASTLPDEPFGQRGMRQYAGRILAWVFTAAALSAFAMGHRSTNYSDHVEWVGQGQMLRITSGGGQLILDAADDEKIKGDGTWTYSGGYRNRRWADRFGWASDLGRTLGIEGAWVSPRRDIDSGFYVRVKWWLLGTVLSIQPAVFVLGRVIAWRRRHAARAVEFA